MSARPTFAQLAGRLIQQQRSKAGFGGGSSGGAGGAGGQGPVTPGAALGGAGGLILLGVGAYVVNSALFNGS